MSQSPLKLVDIKASGVKLTPMMAQYLEIKLKYPDCFVLFRMGDFYEVFFEDAIKASQILSIALTHRGKLGEHKVPMAGIPHHSASAYIDRLTEAGLKVAICEQISKPSDGPGLVKRAVTQIASPSIPFDVDKIDQLSSYYINTFWKKDNSFYLVALDFTTGDFFGHKLEREDLLLDKIKSYQPQEIISFMGQEEQAPSVAQYFKQLSPLLTHLSSDYFDPKYSSHLTNKQLLKLIPNLKADQIISQLPELKIPLGVMAYYLMSTQEQLELHHIKNFRIINDSKFMRISFKALTGLEVISQTKKNYSSSLLGFCDKTQTPMGARFLKKSMMYPLYDLLAIKDRQEKIKSLLDEPKVLLDIRESLALCCDLERVLSKFSRSQVTPNDLLKLATTLQVFLQVQKYKKKLETQKSPKENKDKKAELEKFALSLSENIFKAINNELGASLEKGNLIKPGYCTKRDSLASVKKGVDSKLASLEEKLRQETNILKLRVKRNNIAGFFIEVPKSQTDKVPPSFQRRQTLVNAERYSVAQLQKIEEELIQASANLEEVEQDIFDFFVKEVVEKNYHLLDINEDLTYLDFLSSLAWLARQENFSCPAFEEAEEEAESDDNQTTKKLFKVSGMWHPLIKSNLEQDFIAHELCLDQKSSFGLITGPNMSGKTTVMREMIIVQLLAQMGSFVPAVSAELGLCDQIFSRLGASDEILSGQSTFMVEMNEVSEILAHATEKSMIILDEVGRGTSTYDGLSIAWAMVEYMVEKTRALTLFATHYHELTQLAKKYQPIINLTVETKVNKGDVRFLYRLIKGVAKESFGLYVAQMAGLPREVLDQSQLVLKKLEKDHAMKTNKDSQLDLFQAKDSKMPEFSESKTKLEALKKIQHLNLNELTPLEALNTLSSIQKELNN